MAKRRSKWILAVDIAVVTIDGYILLIQRRKAPFLKKLVLPGGHVEKFDKSLIAAALREAVEEVHLELSSYEVELLMTLDAEDRDPRGRVISLAHVVRVRYSAAELERMVAAGSDAKATVVREIAGIQPQEMGFDHYRVIEELKKRQGRKPRRK